MTGEYKQILRRLSLVIPYFEKKAFAQPKLKSQHLLSRDIERGIILRDIMQGQGQMRHFRLRREDRPMPKMRIQQGARQEHGKGPGRRLIRVDRAPYFATLTRTASTSSTSRRWKSNMRGMGNLISTTCVIFLPRDSVFSSMKRRVSALWNE